MVLCHYKLWNVNTDVYTTHALTVVDQILNYKVLTQQHTHNLSDTVYYIGSSQYNINQLFFIEHSKTKTLLS